MRKLDVKRFAGAFALACVLGVAAVAAFGQDGGPGGGGPHHGGHGFDGHEGGIPFARELNLTDAQKTQIKAINDAFTESTKPLRDKLDALRATEPAPDAAFDEATVRAAAQARAAVQVELEVAHAKMMSQIAGVLTAEQKAQLAAHRQQFEEHRREHGRHGDQQPEQQ